VRRGRGLLALVLVAWLVATVVLFVAPHEDDPSDPPDAVVVLSGAREPRLAKGLELTRLWTDATLVISDGRAPGWRDANRLCDGGSRLDVVCFRPQPYSTHGEAEDVARLARARGWRSLVVVTSRFHVTRSRLLFERCTDGQVLVVAARTSALSTTMNLPFEWGKYLWQLTLERDC
jgi:uncharacterized SAM-binding protein YcdF (DUF218 family)